MAVERIALTKTVDEWLGEVIASETTMQRDHTNTVYNLAVTAINEGSRLFTLNSLDDLDVLPIVASDLSLDGFAIRRVGELECAIAKVRTRAKAEGLDPLP